MKKTTFKSNDIQARSWQVSFNDMLTIILVFFILLISISNIRADRLQDVSSSASVSFGLKEKSDRYADMLRILSPLEGVSVSTVAEGISITLSDYMLYSSGSAEIINKRLLTKISEALKATDAKFRVEGHTDAIPITGALFPTNWELSTQRAVNIVKFFTWELGMNPASFSAAGYADTKPVATNDTPAGRALNRRVNIIISLR